jgi:hypothetical protein
MATYTLTIHFESDDLVEDVEAACVAAYVQIEDAEDITTRNPAWTLARYPE